MKLAELSELRFGYDAVGSTRYDEVPAGYHRLKVRERLGTGDEVFRRAVEALFEWRMHRAGGFGTNADGRAEIGVNVLSRLGVGPVGLPVPCRVVWTVEEEDRAGFGYGTLQGHPQAGEESFVVTREADGIWFTVLAYSRGATWYTRLGGRITRSAQQLAARHYIRTLRKLATGPGESA